MKASITSTILAAIIFSGCTTSPYNKLTGEIVDNGFSQYSTKEAHCFIYTDGDGASMSCIPNTALPPKAGVK